MGSGTTQEESLPLTCASVYSSTLTVSFLLRLNKMIIKDYLGKFPGKPLATSCIWSADTPRVC